MKRYALTDRTIATTRSTTTATQLTDGQGLYLKLQWDCNGQPGGKGHQWRFDYTRPGTKKRNTLSLGAYPTVSLAMARDGAQRARALIAQGIDPGAVKEAARGAATAAAEIAVATKQRAADGLAPAGSLLGVAQDMHAARVATGKWQGLHGRQWLGMIARCVPAHVAVMPIGDIKSRHVYTEIIAPLEAAGKGATAMTVRKFLTQLFAYAERMEISVGNPAYAVRGECKGAQELELGHNPGATTESELRVVMSAICDWGNPVTRAALLVQAMLYQRPGSTCGMRWADVDMGAARWVVPAPKRSKLYKSLNGAAHVVPLPAQVLQILRELQPLTGHSEWVFLSTAGTGGPITNDTLTNALRAMGLGTLQNAHGFRATARSLTDKVCPAGQPQYVEAQLAHKIGMQTIDGRMVRDPNGSAYNRATWQDERRVMLQQWADYLYALMAAAQHLMPVA